jgi:hypothetical protein
MDAFAWRRQCPSGMAVKRLNLRWDTAVYRIDVTCQAVGSAGDSAALSLNPLGQLQGASIYDDACVGPSLIESVTTRLVPGGQIGRLGASCLNVTHSADGRLSIGSIQSPLPSRGSSALGIDAVDSCPNGGALIGIRAGTGSDPGIRSIQVLCTPDAVAWALGTPPPSVAGPLRGDNSVPVDEAVCPTGMFAAGWSLSRDQFIDTVMLACRPF